MFWSYGTSHGCVSCHIRPPIVSPMHSSCMECLLCPVIGNKGTADILVFPCAPCRSWLCQSLYDAHFARTNCKPFACVMLHACSTLVGRGGIEQPQVHQYVRIPYGILLALRLLNDGEQQFAGSPFGNGCIHVHIHTLAVTIKQETSVGVLLSLS